MINIGTAKLIDIMPANLLEDEQVRAAAKAIDSELTKVTALMKECLLIARIDELSSEVVNELAHQWHVDFYEDDLPIEVRRNLIRKSIDWHRHKGTPYAVKEVVSAILEGAQVLENWEYGGDAYCFKVGLIEGDMVGADTIDKLVKAIRQTKNTRSHLDGISFVRYLQQRLHWYTATGLFRKISIYPSAFKMPDLEQKQYFAAARGTFKEVNISWQIGQV